MLKLTDLERQEIIRYLESGRELPEKYRFLLFEDKRESNWSGTARPARFVTSCCRFR